MDFIFQAINFRGSERKRNEITGKHQYGSSIQNELEIKKKKRLKTDQLGDNNNNLSMR